MARRFSRAALLSGLLSAACGGQAAPPGDPIRIDGSSTVYPLSEEVAEQFLKRNSQAQVTVAFSGTRSGFERFCNGLTDIQNASRPITIDEQRACDAKHVSFIELPVAYDGITVIVHPRNTWATDITVTELRTLWQPEAEGKVLRWNQIRPAWPASARCGRRSAIEMSRALRTCVADPLLSASLNT